MPHEKPDTQEVVQLDLLAEIADQNAIHLWGENVARGPHFPLFDFRPEIVAHVFPFIRGADRFPEEDDLIRTVGKLSSRNDLDAFASRFGSIYVSATRENFPVLKASTSLHDRYMSARQFESIAREALGAEDVSLRRIFFFGPHDEHYEFSVEDRSVLISSCGAKLHTLEEIQSAIVRASQGFVPDSSFADRVRTAWQEETTIDLQALDPAVLPSAAEEVRIPLWRLVPPIDFSYWCVPTSFAMTCAFWDNFVKGHGTITGYGRLVDYWMRHPSDPSKNKYGKNVPNIIDEIIDPATGTWPHDPTTGKRIPIVSTINDPNGYSFTHHIDAGTPQNDWGWNVLKAELDDGRPLVWGIQNASIAHAVVAIGYRMQGSQRRVIVLDPPNQHTPTRITEYNYDQFNNTPYVKTSVERLHPGGGIQPHNLAILSPDGGQTLEAFTSCPVTWQVWGSEIAKVTVSFSVDGGSSWSVVATNLDSKPGKNVFVWRPDRPTDQGRLKIEGFSSSNAYLAGDGSQRDFTIVPAPVRRIDSYALGWAHAAHAGYILLRFSKASQQVLGPLEFTTYRRYVDMLRHEKPVSYDPNQRLLLTIPEPVGEEG